MIHTHTTQNTETIRVKGCPVLVEICSCGAKRRPNSQPPKHERTELLGNGWYKIRPDRNAYDLLQNEGYALETQDKDDPIDGINTNLPNID